MTAFATLAPLALSLSLGLAPGAARQSARRLSSGAIARATAQAELESGLRAMNEFDDALALRIFTFLLGEEPPSAIAAKAHLYVGIIEFNRLNTDRARAEFQRAVEADPAVEPPATMSPKAQMVFAEARRAEAIELSKPVAPTPPPAAPVTEAAPEVPPEPPPPPEAAAPEAPPAPEAATPAAVEAPADAKTSRSHTAAYVLGSVAVVGVILAIVGVVYVESFESLRGKLATDPSYTQFKADSSSVTNEAPTAQAWEAVAIAAGAVALGTGTGAGFAW